MARHRRTFVEALILLATVFAHLAKTTVAKADSPRVTRLLSSEQWQFTGSAQPLPEISTDEFEKARWESVTIPHVFQTRAAMTEILRGWYRCKFQVPAEMNDKHFYLVFEGAASIGDVHVNGRHLARHAGAYTRFVVDTKDTIKLGQMNDLAVRVENSPEATLDCMPSSKGIQLYKVWGGLYRKVWLLAVDHLHIDPTDFGSPGVYITPWKVSDTGWDIGVSVLLRNTGNAATGQIRTTLLDPSGVTVLDQSVPCSLEGGERKHVNLNAHVENPKLWQPLDPQLYHVRVDLLSGGKVIDEVIESTGFRTIAWHDGKVDINGKPTMLAGANVHQEIESKASAMSDDDFRSTLNVMKDLGINFIRLPHYPHAKLEYDLCDENGIFCWAENGHSNGGPHTPLGDEITTEMVKQNYNHPSIAVWSVGNEASAAPSEAFVPLVKSLDHTRSVVVANMKCKNADFIARNTYPAWYEREKLWEWNPKGYISETSAGGVATTHCDYAAAKKRIDIYEPEEFQQIAAESRFQLAFKSAQPSGLFLWWSLRDFNDHKYKKPVGWNTKSLLTYAGDKKDVYYLYRCFLRPTEPTVWITSKRYFLRMGDVANGIKAYSNAAALTLTLNGSKVSTIENGKYLQDNAHVVDHVFFWPVKLVTGRNEAVVDDGTGHSDKAIIYFYGPGGEPEVVKSDALVTNVTSSNPKNPAFWMDMPVTAQWPIYYDLDSTADNSFDQLPKEVEEATWIASRRLSKAGQQADLGFSVTRKATVYVMATKSQAAPAFLLSTGFSKVPTTPLIWRDNSLQLVTAELYKKDFAAGDRVEIKGSDRDLLTMIME